MQEPKPNRAPAIAIVVAFIILTIIMIWAAIYAFMPEETPIEATPPAPCVCEEVKPQEPAPAELPKTGVQR